MHRSWKKHLFFYLSLVSKTKWDLQHTLTQNIQRRFNSEMLFQKPRLHVFIDIQMLENTAGVYDWQQQNKQLQLKNGSYAVSVHNLSKNYCKLFNSWWWQHLTSGRITGLCRLHSKQLQYKFNTKCVFVLNTCMDTFFSPDYTLRESRFHTGGRKEVAVFVMNVILHPHDLTKMQLKTNKYFSFFKQLNCALTKTSSLVDLTLNFILSPFRRWFFSSPLPSFFPQ